MREHKDLHRTDGIKRIPSWPNDFCSDTAAPKLNGPILMPNPTGGSSSELSRVRGDIGVRPVQRRNLDPTQTLAR
jgi:hypothetical protein